VLGHVPIARWEAIPRGDMKGGADAPSTARCVGGATTNVGGQCPTQHKGRAMCPAFDCETPVERSCYWAADDDASTGTHLPFTRTNPSSH
jgi:hypothetical protein